MGYLLYSLCFLLLVTATAVFHFRDYLTPYLPPSITHLYTPLPSTFQSDIESGLHSSNFNLGTNLLNSDDARAGLDDKAKKEIRRIMKRKGVGFDEARRLYTVEMFGKNGIAEDGRSTDPKAVTFS